MPPTSFDDPELRTAMSHYVDAARALDEASQLGGEARDLLDLAESKAMAALALRKRLIDLGWTAPSAQRSST